MATAEAVARSLDPGALITLYELDLRPAGAVEPSATILRFHDGIAQGNNEIRLGGKVYTAYPLKAEEFEWSTQGSLPRPKLTVSNVGGIGSALCRQYQDLVGCTLSRIQTFKRFLDGQPNANPNEILPIQKFVIERKTIETATACSFDLSIPSDAEGVQLPRRLIISNTCVWRYRGPECTYTGTPRTNRLGASFGGTTYNGTTFDIPATFTADGGVTAGSKTLTSAIANFAGPDVGKGITKVSGTGNIAAETTIYSMQDEATVTLSKAATVTGTLTFTIVDRVGTYLHSVGPNFSAADLKARITGELFAAGTTIRAVRNANDVDLDRVATLSGVAKPFQIYRITSKGTWQQNTIYAVNDWVSLQNPASGIVETAVSKRDGNQNHVITDENWWWMDVCLKKLSDCRLHFGKSEMDNTPVLPYGGFPGAHKIGTQ